MGEYRLEIATSSRILATSDYVTNLREQGATFFALYRTYFITFVVTILNFSATVKMSLVKI